MCRSKILASVLRPILSGTACIDHDGLEGQNPGPVRQRTDPTHETHHKVKDSMKNLDGQIETQAEEASVIKKEPESQPAG